MRSLLRALVTHYALEAINAWLHERGVSTHGGVRTVTHVHTWSSCLENQYGLSQPVAKGGVRGLLPSVCMSTFYYLIADILQLQWCQSFRFSYLGYMGMFVAPLNSFDWQLIDYGALRRWHYFAGEKCTWLRFTSPCAQVESNSYDVKAILFVPCLRLQRARDQWKLRILAGFSPLALTLRWRRSSQGQQVHILPSLFTLRQILDKADTCMFFSCHRIKSLVLQSVLNTKKPPELKQDQKFLRSVQSPPKSRLGDRKALILWARLCLFLEVTRGFSTRDPRAIGEHLA